MSSESLPLFRDLEAEQVAISARGMDQQRRRLHERFSRRISTRPIFTRRTVSYQGNRNAPGFRWMKYKEGFSSSLVKNLLSEHQASAVLDPFAGIGTVPNLRACVDELSNRHVIRLIEGYFLEMAVVVAELGRIVRPGGTVIMVNDNVQYHGEEVPVDFILSDFAEQSGFTCTDIWVLPTGKGNSSQQMGRFGRREIRKCVYKWVRG